MRKHYNTLVTRERSGYWLLRRCSKRSLSARLLFDISSFLGRFLNERTRDKTKNKNGMTLKKEFRSFLGAGIIYPLIGISVPIKDITGQTAGGFLKDFVLFFKRLSALWFTRNRPPVSPWNKVHGLRAKAESCVLEDICLDP